MYKYTAHKRLVERLDRAKRSKPWSRYWEVSREIQDENNLRSYTERLAFPHYWRDVVFYSKKRLDFVPASTGVLLPAHLFNEEIV